MEAGEVCDTNLLIAGQGKLTTIFNIIEYPKALEREIEVLFPKKEDFITAIEVTTALLKGGKPLPAVDVILASMCMNRGLVFRTMDKHFGIIRAEFPKFRLKEE